MTEFFIQVLDIVAPPLTIRRQFLALCGQVPGVLRHEGIGEVGRRAWAALTRYRETGGLVIPVYPDTEPEPETPTYAEWMAATEPTAQVFAQQQALQNGFAYQPLISVIVPVFNPSADILAAAIESVLSQTYENWQLCLADGGSTSTGVNEVLHHISDDGRIDVAFLEKNLGISANSNAALALARGDFVALLDHDDVLAPNMLFEVVALLNHHPEADIVFFDEDKISADGTARDHPWFKPDFSPDMMLSANLLMHGVFRRSLMLSAGAFDPATDGAQDWDLALRCTRLTDAIYHIPKILYHWRQVPGSASLDADAKPWAFDAQVAALQRHVGATDGVSVQVEFPSLGRTRICWPRSTDRVSIIIPTKDKAALLRTCIDSIVAKTDYADYEIVLVDTGSTADDVLAYYDELLGQYDNVRLVDLPGAFNYSRANNVGAAAATGNLLLFLNNDTEVIEPDWLQELAGWAARPGVGVVGAKLLNADGTVQHAGIIVGLSGHANHIFGGMPEDTHTVFESTAKYRTYHAVTGACMMVPRSVFDRIGGFDEVYQVAFSDVEFCLRAEDAGFRIVYTPFARLRHDEGASRGKYIPASDILRATCQMYQQIRHGDGNFNTNLSLQHKKPRLSLPDEPGPLEMLAWTMSAHGLVSQPPSGSAVSVEDLGLAQPMAWPETRLGSHTRSFADLSILVVTPDLNHSASARLAVHLAESLSTAGPRVVVVSPVAGLPGDSQYLSSVPTIIARPPEPWLSRGDVEGMIDVGALTQAMQDTDIVIACDAVAPVAINTAVAFDVPCILWLSDSVARHSLAETDPAMLDAIRYANRVVAESRYAASRFSRYLRPERALIASNTNSQPAPRDFVHAAGASSELSDDGEGRTDSAVSLDALLDRIADVVADAVRAERQYVSTAQR